MAVTAMEWDDGPSCDLFPEGSEDHEWFKKIPDRPVKPAQTPNTSSSDVQYSNSSGPTFDNTPQFERPNNTLPATFDTAPQLPWPNDIPGPVFDASPISFQNPFSVGHEAVAGLHEAKEMYVEVRSGSSSHANQSKNRRVAHSPDNVPKMKKIKIDAHGDALHQQYVMNRYPIKKPKKDEILWISVNFHVSRKPRAEIDNEVMTLYLKTFNYDQLVNRKKPKKMAFSVLMSVKLSVEPDVFDPKVCEKEFRKACLKNSISNSDLIANIKSVAMREPLFKHDLESSTLFTPNDYPKQTTKHFSASIAYDCDYYSVF